MKNDFEKIIRIIGTALLFGWLVWGAFGILLVSGEKDGKAGQFGDFFGGFNALVSVLGFGAVIYSFHLQREDSKEADARHQQMLNKQQELFEQNAKIALFEKRYQIYETLRSFIETCATGTAPRIEALDELAHLRDKLKFLFPNGLEIALLAEALYFKGDRMNKVYASLEMSSPQIEINVEYKELYRWFMSITSEFRDLISPHLNLTSTFIQNHP